MLYALRTTAHLSTEVACFGVVTHPIDAGARCIYERWGFEPLPADQHGAMILRMADIRASGIT